jgi:hypothetical protein
MISDVFLVFVTVFAVFVVELPIVIFLTPRLVVRWIRHNAGKILEDMLSDQSVKELLNDASRRLVGHIVGGQGGRPPSVKGIVAQIASQLALQWIGKSGVIPSGAAEVVTEAAKGLK